MYARSGDVIFRPTTATKLKGRFGEPEAHKDFAVAVGETTGHAHRVRGKVDVFGVGTVAGILLKDKAEVTHEDHDTITLEPGAYEVGQEQETRPGREAAYAVAD